MATIIPKQHYVTIQYRGKDVLAESGHLGFASPYTKDAAFRKRKATQDQWAYGYGTAVNIDENDDITVVGGGKQGGYGHMDVDASTLFMTNCYPIIINNDPVEGFQIAKSVKRGGGWGPGNVVWRISDPRGFELEISSSNFAAVLSCTTMVNGVIEGKCVWGRNGKDNILLPEASSVYQEAHKLTEKIEKNISLKDVQIGDTVELLNPHMKGRYQYFGKYYFLVPDEEADSGDRYRYGGNGVYFFNKKQVERYLLKDIDNKKYITLSTPKIADIVETVGAPLDKMDIAKEVTGWLGRQTRLSDINTAILASPTKIKLGEVVTQLVPLTEKIESKWPLVGEYYADTIVSEFDGKMWKANQTRNFDHSTRTYDNNPMLEQVEVDTAQNKIKVVYTYTKEGSWYSSYHSRQTVKSKDFTFDQLKMYRIEVTANGITGKVFKL